VASSNQTSLPGSVQPRLPSGPSGEISASTPATKFRLGVPWQKRERLMTFEGSLLIEAQAAEA